MFRSKLFQILKDVELFKRCLQRNYQLKQVNHFLRYLLRKKNFLSRSVKSRNWVRKIDLETTKNNFLNYLRINFLNGQEDLSQKGNKIFLDFQSQKNKPFFFEYMKKKKRKKSFKIKWREKNPEWINLRFKIFSPFFMMVFHDFHRNVGKDCVFCGL